MGPAALNLGLTFLAPIAGIVAASLSVPLLALLYFLKLRRRPMRVSSTLLWDASAADLQVNVPFRWIRLSWLLLIQIALLALLSLAIARPAIERSEAPSGRIAIVIDQSASMSARDARIDRSSEPVMRIESARSQALDLIDRLDSGAEAMVVSMGARPRSLASLTRDRGMLRRAVESVEPTDEPSDLPATLRLVGAALRTSEEDAAPGRVVLFTDGALETTTGRGPSGLGRARIDFLRQGPAESDPKDNLGIVAIAAKREYEDPSVVRLFIRVQSVVPRSVETSLTILVDGEAEVAERVTLPPASDEGEPVEQIRTFELDHPGGGLIVARLSRRDDLSSDDAAALILDPPEAPRIGLVQPSVRSRLIDLLAFDALESIGPRSIDVIDEGELDAALRSGGLEQRFDLLVLDRVRPAQLPPVPTISLGAGLPIPGLIVRRPDDDDPRGAPTEFAIWSRTHPIMRAVGLSSVRVDQPLEMRLPEPRASLDAARVTSVIELASGQNGPLIALIEDRGIRRVLVAFELASSRWWQDPSFPIFIKNAVDHLTLGGSDRAGRSWRTGQNVLVRADPRATEIAVAGPLSFTRPIDREQVEQAGGRMSLGPLALAGLYELDGAQQRDRLLPVNLESPVESAIATRDAITVGAASTPAISLGESAPREIWQWLILAALVLLALEWCVFSWKMRV